MQVGFLSGLQYRPLSQSVQAQWIHSAVMVEAAVAQDLPSIWL